jgi:hypothetical protein
MPDQHASISNPADLLLRISRTPAGLCITSPQLPKWMVMARGPVPIARALETAFTELACAAYAEQRGERYDLQTWDANAEAFAAAGGAVLNVGDTVTADRVIRDGRALRRSGRPAKQRPLTRVASTERPSTGKFVPQHDPFAWTDLGNGQWRSPGGGIYGEATRVVQGVIRRRNEAATSSSAQPTFDDVAS